MPRPVGRELERLGDRWRALPVAQADEWAAQLRELAQLLADRVAAEAGERPAVLPDLGPAVVLDQLAVLVYDAAAAHVCDGVAEELALVRRSLP